jgi:glutaminase
LVLRDFSEYGVCIAYTLPGQFAIAAFSPRLNAVGISIHSMRASVTSRVSWASACMEPI